MDRDMQEQISDLKSLLRTAASLLEKHLQSSGDSAGAEELRADVMRHHQYRTGRLDRVCTDARKVINKASGCEGGPRIEDLEERYGWHLPGEQYCKMITPGTTDSHGRRGRLG